LWLTGLIIEIRNSEENSNSYNNLMNKITTQFIDSKLLETKVHSLTIAKRFHDLEISKSDINCKNPVILNFLN
jgi:hypothetical protein